MHSSSATLIGDDFNFSAASANIGDIFWLNGQLKEKKN
jgi:hypothetical protein